MIDTTRKVGSSFPDLVKQQPLSYGRREDGRYSVVPWACLDASQTVALASSIDALGYNYEVVNGFGGRSTISIEYPFNNIAGFAAPAGSEAEHRWEIVPEKAFKDILDSRNPLVLASSQQEVNLLKGWRRLNQLETNLMNTDGIFKQPQIPSASGGSATNFSANGTRLAKALFDGVEQVEINATKLTHTTTVTPQYINPASFVNCGWIHSTATLITTESIPSAVLFDFPTDTDPDPIAIGSTGVYQTFLYGWLKHTPSVRQISRAKWNIVQEYDYGLWLMDVYNFTRL